MNKVISINRQYASHGGDVAHKLGKELGLKVYDKEILELIAKDCGYKLSYIEDVVEMMKNTASFDVSSFMGLSMQAGMSKLNLTGEDIFNSQVRVVRELAKEPCIIVGRCADYILKDYDNVINVFVYASVDRRCEYIMKKQALNQHEAMELIKKQDKFRSKYYHYYCERKWAEPTNYHLMLNTDNMSLDQCIEAVKGAYLNK